MTSDIELIEYGTPFSYDQRNKELFVMHNDFSFVVREDMESLCYYVYTWIKEDKKITKGKVVDFLDDCKTKRRYFADFKLEKYTLTCAIKKEANTGLNTVNLNIFTKDLAKWLAENMYLSCCAKCGEESDIFLDHIDGKALVICDDCKHGKAKVFVDPTTPAPKEAAKPKKPEVDIFDLSDLMPQTDEDDDISDFADEAVLPVSDKDNEMPDLDRFEAVSLDDDLIGAADAPVEEIAETPSPVVEVSEEILEIPEKTDIDDIFEELLPKKEATVNTVAEPVFAEAAKPAEPAPKSVEVPSVEEMLTPMTAEAPKPAAPAPKPAEAPSFEEMLTPTAVETPKPAAPKPVETPSFEEMLTPMAVEAPKPTAHAPKRKAAPSFEDMLTPVVEEKPAAVAAAPSVTVSDMAPRTSEPKAAPAVTLPQGYSPDNPTNDKGEYFHPLMTKKKSDDEPAEEAMTAKIVELPSDNPSNKGGLNFDEEQENVKVESMENGEELHDAFKHLAGNSKNIDVMIDREIGYKSKSDNEINKLTQASAKNKEFLQTKGEVASSNIALGILGCFIFGLVAVACWAFVGFMLYNDPTLDSLGYIMGIFLAFAVVSGYQKIGRYLDAKGIITSFIMAVVLTFVSVSGYSCLVIYDQIRCYDDAHRSEAQAVCEYAMLDEAARTPEKLDEYLGRSWGKVEIIDGFKYALYYDDAYDYLQSDELITVWFPKDGYTVMGRYYQDLILSFVVVAITFVLAVANAQNWKRSTKS